MTQHYTKNTVSAIEWCAKCRARTPHRIDNGRKGPCEICMKRLEDEHAKAKPEPQPQQQGLFGK